MPKKKRKRTARSVKIKRARFDLAMAILGAPSRDRVKLSAVVDAHIERVLDATDNNLSLAAELLGMHRRSLQRVRRRKGH